jgi:hypothetical protein
VPGTTAAAPVWYVAYGSNLLGARLHAYLVGGDGPFGRHRGCADATPPRADLWLDLDSPLAFRGTSLRWGGGVAFLDHLPTAGVATPARAWLVTRGQLLDLAAQEARLAEAPPPGVLDAAPVDGTTVIGGGWYDTVLRLADLDGRPAFALTTSQDLPVTSPTDAYLATIAAGRAERPVSRAAPGGARRSPPPRRGASGV